tara:strand:- start:3384 stop:4088 length:705 start_codon:yes stop_codon:yes gene_type:complete
MNNLSVVLCTYNEEKFIEKTLVNLIKNEIVKEIIIVDDNSNDQTINIIEGIKSNKIKLFIRKNVRGFASALNLGISKASERYILRFDVDMFSEIDYFLDTFKNYNKKDCVIFSRYIYQGEDRRGNFRKFHSFVLNKICVLMLSSKIKDYTSCIMFFDKKILNDIPIKNTIYANFIIEFCFMLIMKKKNYLEVPLIQNKNTEENSKSAPNLLTFIKNGSLYILTIIKCFIVKFIY